MARRRKRPKHSGLHMADSLHDAPPVEELDLHGYRLDQIAALVHGFLASWQTRGSGLVVRIITGRGNNSANGPVLRGRVANLLHGELRRYVADYTLDDGDGGYKVKLR